MYDLRKVCNFHTSYFILHTSYFILHTSYFILHTHLMPQPKIKIELEPIDYIIEVLGVIGILVLITLPVYFIDQLPDTVPSHFDGSGQPND
ncbi:MAG: DUF1648 domain-containing protein, partial [Saprospiraceae bacterium]|nr:DUF1648 domain-containing protein [Saprospiraceae bacterium]